MKMERAFYSNTVPVFINENEDSILGKMIKSNPFPLEDLQRNSWIEEIRILKKVFETFNKGYLLFEYSIPRMGRRIDTVFLSDGLVFLIEFKIGLHEYSKFAVDQIADYALDLKNFHKESHNKLLIPILVATNASNVTRNYDIMKEGILEVLRCNTNNFLETINIARRMFRSEDFVYEDWKNSPYFPTPTIIEAAQTLYQGHKVTDIARNDATATNLNETNNVISSVIYVSKKNNRKSICFITGVPGAGKTLAGLNIANERHNFDSNEHAVFLSGNQPLVDVLQEALARDEKNREGVRKNEALKKAKAFIQNIHHFRDDALTSNHPPIEKVVIFDEAQRAWTRQMLTKFMKQKKGVINFQKSEPDFLIEIMDRHNDWAVIICLIGGGQEINTGEAGLLEWFDTLKKKYSHWDVYVSNKIYDNEYTTGIAINQLFSDLRISVKEKLHLSVSLRSFRSEKVSSLIKAILDLDIEAARRLYQDTNSDYPILITRDLECAKSWVRTQAKGTERYGITASSGAKRLRSQGLWVQNKISAKDWFLNDKNDVRSSYFLEETATEFDIQGLELDWTIVCWDANFRYEGNKFSCYEFNGSKWTRIIKPDKQLYLKNAYRVLLTRARQGMVIFVPKGSHEDKTRLSSFYDGVFNYLKEIGIKEI